MINPTKEQLDEIMTFPGHEPFVMVNLLKFKEEGSEKDREAYERYARAMIDFLAKFKARVIWAGEALHSFIGEPHETWDKVILVEYPSREVFMATLSSTEFSRYNSDRMAGLERMALVMCRQQFMA